MSNFASRPPRVTNVRPQAITRPRVGPTGPFVTNVRQQPTTRPIAPPASPVATPAVAGSVPAYPTGQIGLPPDATYEQQVAGAQLGRSNTLAGLVGQRTQGLQSFGYTEGQIDPSTGYGQTTFDPSNPFSQAALALKHYQQSQAGNTTSMAARGQLYSGALQNAQDFTTSGYNQQNDSIQRALIKFLSTNTGAQRQADVDYQTALSTFGADRLSRAQQDALNLANLQSLAGQGAPAAGAPAAAAGPAAGPAATTKPPGFQGVKSGVFVTPQMWDPRGFWTAPWGRGKTIHVYPDGHTAVF